MTLVQAIDRNIELKGELLKEGRVEKALAVQLGLEALMMELFIRSQHPKLHYTLLPGETKE